MLNLRSIILFSHFSASIVLAIIGESLDTNLKIYGGPSCLFLPIRMLQVGVHQRESAFLRKRRTSTSSNFIPGGISVGFSPFFNTERHRIRKYTLRTSCFNSPSGSGQNEFTDHSAHKPCTLVEASSLHQATFPRLSQFEDLTSLIDASSPFFAAVESPSDSGNEGCSAGAASQIRVGPGRAVDAAHTLNRIKQLRRAPGPRPSQQRCQEALQACIRAVLYAEGGLLLQTANSTDAASPPRGAESSAHSDRAGELSLVHLALALNAVRDEPASLFTPLLDAAAPRIAALLEQGGEAAPPRAVAMIANAVAAGSTQPDAAAAASAARIMRAVAARAARWRDGESGAGAGACGDDGPDGQAAATLMHALVAAPGLSAGDLRLPLRSLAAAAARLPPDHGGGGGAESGGAGLTLQGAAMAVNAYARWLAAVRRGDDAAAAAVEDLEWATEWEGAAGGTGGAVGGGLAGAEDVDAALLGRLAGVAQELLARAAADGGESGAGAGGRSAEYVGRALALLANGFAKVRSKRATRHPSNRC
jgi:hypothetical protein